MISTGAPRVPHLTARSIHTLSDALGKCPPFLPKPRNRYDLHAIAEASLEADDDSQSLEKPRYEWNKQNFAIGVPALIGMLADPLLSLMDTAYVGRVGSLELAALGACTSIFHLAFNAFRATTTATTSLVATNLEQDKQAAKEVTSISLWFGWWAGVAVAATLMFGGNFALSSMGVSRQSELYPAASDYLFTRSWAAPVVLFVSVAEGAFRGYGDTVIPLFASLTAAIVNLVLDPVLMFRMNMGVKGAAAATALAQVGAAAMYAFQLIRRRMLPSVVFNKKNEASSMDKKTLAVNKRKKTTNVIRTIVGANLAILMKQGSLLLGWAYATARATRLGSDQVAAHQVALSVWLIFALIQDGTAVSAQVLMSRAYAQKDRPQFMSLVRYMTGFALIQGIVSMLVLDGIDLFVPRLFTPDKVVQHHLHKLMGPLSLQQVLVSLTLVMESLAIGASQFNILALGSVLSSVAAVYQLSQQTSVQTIWSKGIVTLFAVRLIMAVVAVVRARWSLKKKDQSIAREAT